MGAPPLWPNLILIISQRAHLQIPHWSLGLQKWILGGTIIQSITVQYILRYVGHLFYKCTIYLANDLWNTCLIFEKLLIYVTFSLLNYISNGRSCMIPLNSSFSIANRIQFCFAWINGKVVSSECGLKELKQQCNQGLWKINLCISKCILLATKLLQLSWHVCICHTLQSTSLISRCFVLLSLVLSSLLRVH